jgi:ribosomal protein S27E
MTPVKCEQCGKEFKSKQGLKIHIGRQHSSKPKAKRGRKKSAPAGGITCKICGRSFKLPLHLGRHMAASHKKAKRARRARRVVAPRVPRTPRADTGVDVTILTVDQLLGLRTAVDARLAEIVRRMRQARVKV